MAGDRDRRRVGIATVCFAAIIGAIAFFASRGAGLTGVAGVDPALPAAGASQGPYRELRWHELAAPSWDAYAELRQLRREAPAHGERESNAMLAKLRQVWDTAPPNPQLEGQSIRLAGYVVPLEQQGGAISEFLLVPNFGDCIHSPPPPANQIVHVTPRQPLVGTRAMSTVWVSGTLHAQPSSTPMGASGYALRSALVQPYVASR